MEVTRFRTRASCRVAAASEAGVGMASCLPSVVRSSSRRTGSLRGRDGERFGLLGPFHASRPPSEPRKEERAVSMALCESRWSLRTSLGDRSSILATERFDDLLSGGLSS